MTFVKRVMSVTLQLKDEKKSTAGRTDTVKLDGYRVQAAIHNGDGTFAQSVMELAVYGMKVDDMRAFQTRRTYGYETISSDVLLMAGDEGGILSQVFLGGFRQAWIDYSGAPDVCLRISAQASMYSAFTPAAANSFDGSTDAATILESLSKKANLTFVNNGVVGVMLNNMNLTGSVIDQIKATAQAANIPFRIDNGKLEIWPGNGYRNDTVVTLSPETGLVGYPTFTQYGIMAKSVFNPELGMGGKVKLETSLPDASGDWYVTSTTHELSTMEPGGPWFSTSQCVPDAYSMRTQ